MPIKPPQRPRVSAATGRPSAEGPGRASARPTSGQGPAPRASGRPVPIGNALAADRPTALYLSCPSGVEELLADEVRRILGEGPIVIASRGGVEVQAAPALRTADECRAALIDHTLRLNLESRLAQRVLWRVASRVYRHEDDIYALGRQVNWSDWITPRHTLRVDVTSRRSHLRSLNFAGLRIKDAVCDDLRERTGERPSVDTRHPDLGLVLYMDDLDAVLYVDTSGEALFKRGWREDTGEAPLKETLAAAMLAAAGWQGRPEDGPLLDPCCGAGTIAIEAAQITCNIAPGIHRRFAFERLLPFRGAQAAWGLLKQAARARECPPRVPIYAGDVAFRMTDFATRNAERAGVRHAIEFKTADALQRPVPCEHGVLMFNPPYGERIDTKGSARNAYGQRAEQGGWDEPADPDDGIARPGVAGVPGVRTAREAFQEDEAAATFFQRLSSHWKKNYSGWTAWILSPDMKLPSAMRLKESRRVVMFNGPIECRLFRFDLVAGSHKPRAAMPASDDQSGASPAADASGAAAES